MLFGEIMRVALQSIQANLFRAILTMLGIIIGVGAVITMLAAGAGAQQRIDEQIAALGSNILSINASRFLTRGVSRDQATLEVDDAFALAADATYIDAVVPEIQSRGQLKFGNNNTNVRVTGTTANYYDVFSYDLAAGRFFTEGEDQSRRRVVVLGSDVPQDLEAEIGALVGSRLTINSQPFEVVGVLDSIGGGFGNRSPDDMAFIPLRTAEQRLFGREELENISARVRDGVELERAMVDIERVLRR